MFVSVVADLVQSVFVVETRTIAALAATARITP